MLELDFQSLDSVISAALQEDLGFGDITTQAVVSPNMKARGEFVAKQDFILAGWPVVVRIFHHVSEKIAIESSCRDGDAVAKGIVFGNLSGPAARLLSGERVIELSPAAFRCRHPDAAVCGSGFGDWDIYSRYAQDHARTEGA